MAKKGLNRELIIDAATAMIEEQGLEKFSLRGLAESLGVRAASLYNHIGGQQELLEAVGLRAVELLTRLEAEAVANRQRDDALYALADAYRGFAHSHTELYRIIMEVHSFDSQLLESAAKHITEPILDVLAEYGVEGELLIHYQRMLRSLFHGFFAHEHSGSFSFSDVDRDLSYHMAVACVAAQLNHIGEAGQ